MSVGTILYDTEYLAADLVLYPSNASSHPQPPAVTTRKASRPLSVGPFWRKVTPGWEPVVDTKQSH